VWGLGGEYFFAGDGMLFRGPATKINQLATFAAKRSKGELI
jgi:hypothetical protein